MARYAQSIESATGAPAWALVTVGVAPVFATGTGMYGYLGALVAGTGTALKLRRLTLGCRVAGGGVPTSQQMTVGIFRQTVRGVGTTGWGNVAGGTQLDPNSAASTSAGMDYVSSATWAPTMSVAPTVGNNPVYRVSFNTQNTVDVPFEGMEELYVPPAASNNNGLAFVSIAGVGSTNTLPTNHLFTIGCEWEE